MVQAFLPVTLKKKFFRNEKSFLFISSEKHFFCKHIPIKNFSNKGKQIEIINLNPVVFNKYHYHIF